MIISGPSERWCVSCVAVKPRKVQLVTADSLLSAGKPHVLQCESVGSVPPAQITWLLDGEAIRGYGVTLTKGVNTTSSTLTLRPRASDHGRELTCRTENPHFRGGMLEDRRRLHVAYPPVVSVQLETSAARAALKEGDEVRLTCEVRANPQPDRITWYHEGGLLGYNETSGVLPDDRLLRLRAIERTSAGEYSCSAGNREGETRSAPIRIRVQYAPRCRKGFASRRVGALRHKALTARCEVEADPGGDDVKFWWTFGNSREVVLVSGERVSSKGLASQLKHEPRTDADFGTLACWASNSVGQQQQPCVVQVVPAKSPQPPEECALRNHSSGRLEVACVAGDDGDLPQHFVLEVSEAPAPPAFQPPAATLNDQALPLPGPPLYRMLGAEPLFSLQNLEPGRDYHLALFAENAKGRSEPPVTIPSVRVAAAMEKLTRTDIDEETNSASAQPMAIVLGVLISAAVLIVGGIFVTAAFVTCRRRAALAQLDRAAPKPSRRRPGTADAACPRPRCLADGSGERTSDIEDEGGGQHPLHVLHEPDLIISRAELAMGQSVIQSPC